MLCCTAQTVAMCSCRRSFTALLFLTPFASSPLGIFTQPLLMPAVLFPPVYVRAGEIVDTDVPREKGHPHKHARASEHNTQQWGKRLIASASLSLSLPVCLSFAERFFVTIFCFVFLALYSRKCAKYASW